MSNKTMDTDLEQRRAWRAQRIDALRQELKDLLDEEAKDLCGNTNLNLDELRAQCKVLSAKGPAGFVEAVKLYRSKTGLSLKEAHDAVKHIN